MHSKNQLMHSPADNFSRVERLNHFISVFRDNKRERRREDGQKRGAGDGTGARFVGVQKGHFQGSNYDEEKM